MYIHTYTAFQFTHTRNEGICVPCGRETNVPFAIHTESICRPKWSMTYIQVNGLASAKLPSGLNSAVFLRSSARCLCACADIICFFQTCVFTPASQK